METKKYIEVTKWREEIKEDWCRGDKKLRKGRRSTQGWAVKRRDKRGLTQGWQEVEEGKGIGIILRSLGIKYNEEEEIKWWIEIEICPWKSVKAHSDIKDNLYPHILQVQISWNKLQYLPLYLCFSTGVVPAFANSAKRKYNSFLTIFLFELISCSIEISPSTNWRIVISTKSKRVCNDKNERYWREINKEKSIVNGINKIVKSLYFNKHWRLPILEIKNSQNIYLELVW